MYDPSTNAVVEGSAAQYGDRSMTRRDLLKTGAAAVAAASLPASQPSTLPAKSAGHPQRNRPNILIIMSDQHSRQVLGCHGNRIVRTPHLDRLAREGMRFDNAYCPSPLCVPSRMSFMTGRTPSQTRCWDNEHILSSAIPTWAHVLTVAGYETSLIGRMHFVGYDHRHGFENRPLGESSATPPGVSVARGWEWARYTSEASSRTRQGVEVAGTGTTHYQWYDTQVVDATCRYLREHGGKGTGRPFAAVAGFLLPHNPYIAPADLFEYYYDKVDIPRVETDQPAAIRRARASCGLQETLPDARVRASRAAYYGLCEQLDRNVGKILECLQETGLADRTLVIYCSDHGEMAGEHGLWAKSVYYEGSVGIPMLARLPGTIAPGSTCTAICNLLDVGPTLIDQAGSASLEGIAGRSLWPFLQGQVVEKWRDETYSELVDLVVWPRGSRPDNFPCQPSRMIRRGPWKLFAHEDEENLPPVLFNLADDPQELHDLSSDPRYSNVRAELWKALHIGWDADAARAGAIDASRSRRWLVKWGKIVKPPAPDALPFPADDIEQDVKLS